MRGNLPTAHNYAPQGLELAEPRAALIIGSTRRASWPIQRSTLDTSPIAGPGSTGAALYDQERGETLRYPVPQDPKTAVLALLPTVAWLLGDSRGAEEAIARGLRHVDALGRDFDKAMLHGWTAGTRYTQRRYHQAEEHAMVAIGISKDKYSDWAGTGALMMALAQSVA